MTATATAPDGLILSDGDTEKVRALALIVDDDPSIRRLCGAVLERDGWDVREADNGLAAVEFCRDQVPDSIIMDVNMPEMDGLEATRRLRASAATEGVPIVILSGNDTRTDIEAGLEAGADTYICKPFHVKDFALRVRALSRLRRVWREIQRDRAVLGEQARALSLLANLSEALVRKDDLHDILYKVMEVTAELTSCRRISVMLPDPSGRFLTIAASVGLDAQVVENVKLAIGESIAGRVFATGRPIVLNDQEEARRVLNQNELRLFEGLPMLSMPLRASEKTVGVINLTSRFGERPFDAQELGYLSLITNYSASAIQNVSARLARDRARDSIVIALAKLAEHRDDETGKHLDRVTLFCVKLAEELRKNPTYARQIDEEFFENLKRAAPLHDIGKVAIPDAILLKPGKLTDAEMDVMRTHATIGAETIRSLVARAPDSAFLRMAEDIAIGHHEWFNGEGYPNGISGDAIPLAARILALADVYDALTTRRAYKEPYSHRKSVEIIVKESGTHFDPGIVHAFLQVEPAFERLAKEMADRANDFNADGNSPLARSPWGRERTL